MKKTKYFDRKIYEKDKKIKTAFIILIVFLFGLYAGLAIHYLEIQDKDRKIREQYVELDNLREIIYQEELQDGR